jgi:hypothetical protein
MSKRRDFIRQSALGSAGIVIGGMGLKASSYSSILGSNDRINLAVLGFRSRGDSHIDELCSLKDLKNVRITTLCDVDEQFFGAAVKKVLDKTGVKPSTEWDMRKVFDDPGIHAVTIATPNHWHALATIWASQAGKHVYVEKPCCHNIFEGQKMIEAAKKYKVRVQVGFQNRSGKNLNEAIKFIHDGGIGDVYMARGLCLKPRDSFGIAPTVNRLHRFIMTCGRDLLPISHITRKGFITTGTGSGTPATAIPATRALMSLMLPAGG